MPWKKGINSLLITLLLIDVDQYTGFILYKPVSLSIDLMLLSLWFFYSYLFLFFHFYIGFGLVSLPPTRGGSVPVVRLTELMNFSNLNVSSSQLDRFESVVKVICVYHI